MSTMLAKRYQDQVRKIALQPENKECCDCTHKQPTYVCLEFGIFICENCASIHRQFGHTGIKGISVSNFSKQDVSVLENGGNVVCQKTFFPPDFQKPRNEKPKDPKMKNPTTDFIKAIYVDKKYSTDKKSEKFKQERKSSMLSKRKTSGGNTLSMKFEDTLKPNEKVNGVSSTSNSIVTENKTKQPEKSKEADLMDFFSSPSTTETKPIQKEQTTTQKSGFDLNDLFAPSTNSQPVNQSWNNQPQQQSWNNQTQQNNGWQQTQQQSWNSQQQNNGWNSQQQQSWNNQPQQSWNNQTQQNNGWNGQPQQQSWNNQPQQKQQPQKSSNPFDDMDFTSNTNQQQPVNNNAWNQSSSNPFESNSGNSYSQPKQQQHQQQQQVNNGWNQQTKQPQQQQAPPKNDPFADFTQLDTFKTMQPKKTPTVNPNTVPSSQPKGQPTQNTVKKSNTGSFGHDDFFSAPTTAPKSTNGTNKPDPFGSNDDDFLSASTKPQQNNNDFFGSSNNNSSNGSFGKSSNNTSSFDRNNFQPPKLNHVNVQQSSNQSEQNINIDGHDTKGNLQTISGQESDKFSWENNFFSGASNIDDLRGKSNQDEFDSQFKTISAKNVTPFGSSSDWQ
eukprot:gene395-6809_t